MPKPSAQVTAAEISRLAGVTRATVSNWRRRHADFPAPSAGTESSPLYDLRAVRAWLEKRGHVAAVSPEEELRSALRLHSLGETAVARALALILTAARSDRDTLGAWAELPDTDLLAQADAAAAQAAADIPDAADTRFGREDTGLLRALLRLLRDGDATSALDMFAERELGKSVASGAYLTPEPLADLMARLLAPDSESFPARVLDPACGSGGTLAAAARHGAERLYGQDIVPVQAQRTAVALKLAAPSAAVTVHAGDSLRADAFDGVTVDGALCAPPYGIRDWGHDELAYDPRWAYGLPARVESELAWVQHALAHLEPGRCAVLLLTPGVAARGSGRRVRAALLRTGAVRAVVAVPPGAAAPLHIGLHLWVLQRPADEDAGGRDAVLFVDTAAEDQQTDRTTAPGSTPRPPGSVRHGRDGIDWDRLRDTALTHWQAFAANPRAFTAVPGIAHAVPVVDLLDDLVDLTPARHVRAAGPAADPTEVVRQAGDLADRLASGINSLATAVGSVGDVHPAGPEPRPWRTATLADLARGSALSLYRVEAKGREDAETAGHAAGPAEDWSGKAILTARDVATGHRASGDPADLRNGTPFRVKPGDVLLAEMTGTHGTPARVADDHDAGSLLGPRIHLIRPDPDRLDPWFLAGFLGTDENLTHASTGSTVTRLQPRRLRVPLLPLAKQSRYGAAFRRLHELRTAAHQAAELASSAVDFTTLGLTSGVVLPPDTDTSA